VSKAGVRDARLIASAILLTITLTLAALKMANTPEHDPQPRTIDAPAGEDSAEVPPARAPLFFGMDQADFARARNLEHQWNQDARQLENPTLRARALREIAEAAFDTDSARVVGALLSIRDLDLPEFHRRRFRDRVVALIASDEACLRWVAIGALRGVRAGPNSLDAILPLTRDPDVNLRAASALAIARLFEGDLTGRAAEPLLRLLSDEHEGCVRGALRAVGTARRLPDSLAECVVELTRSEDAETRRHAIAALAGIGEKSERVVARLLELARPRYAEHWRKAVADLGGIGDGPAVDLFVGTLRDSYHERRRGAFMALRGVPDAQKERAADLLLSVLEETSEPVVMSFCLDLLGLHATEKHVEPIEAWAANDALTESQRGWADGPLRRIRRRLGK